MHRCVLGAYERIPFLGNGGGPIVAKGTKMPSPLLLPEPNPKLPPHKSTAITLYATIVRHHDHGNKKGPHNMRNAMSPTPQTNNGCTSQHLHTRPYPHQQHRHRRKRKHQPCQHVDDGQEHEHSHAIRHALGDQAVPVFPIIPASATAWNSQGPDAAPAPAGGGEGPGSRRFCGCCLFSLILFVIWRAGVGGCQEAT